LRKLSKTSQGNNKGYFTLEDFIFSMQMIPNEYCTDNEIEQTLCSLLREGKIKESEIGTGKFELVGEI
jgi:hypothetical protein